jgi:F420H(2)-dependent quinone reductase
MASDYNAAIIEEFRATGGHPGGDWAGTPMILIDHIGARSGTERVTPLGYLPVGDGRFAVVASSGASPSSPRRALAEAGRPVPRHRRVPGHDHPADPGIPANPSSLNDSR